MTLPSTNYWRQNCTGSKLWVLASVGPMRESKKPWSTKDFLPMTLRIMGRTKSAALYRNQPEVCAELAVPVLAPERTGRMGRTRMLQRTRRPANALCAWTDADRLVHVQCTCSWVVKTPLRCQDLHQLAGALTLAEANPTRWMGASCACS